MEGIEEAVGCIIERITLGSEHPRFPELVYIGRGYTVADLIEDLQNLKES